MTEELVRHSLPDKNLEVDLGRDTDSGESPRREILIDYLAISPVVYNTGPESSNSGTDGEESKTITPSTPPQVEVLSFIERVDNSTVGITINVNQLPYGAGPVEELAKIAIQVKTPPISPQGSTTKLIKDSIKYGASREVLDEVNRNPNGEYTEVDPPRPVKGKPRRHNRWVCWSCYKSEEKDKSETYTPAENLRE